MNPVTEQVEMAFKLRQRLKNLSSFAYFFTKTFNLVISRRCLADDGEEMYQIYNARVGPFFFLIISYRFVTFTLPSPQ